MANQLIWSIRASDEYDMLFQYLMNEWGDQIALSVLFQIQQKINHLLESPELFPIFIKRKKIRRCVASPQTSIYYKVKGHNVEIVALIDNRQNPRKRKL